MREQWRRLAVRFEAMQQRERVLILLAAVVGTALVYDTIALRPLDTRRKQLTQQLTESRQAIRTNDAMLKAQESVSDPAAVKRSYRDALRKQLAEIDQNMQGLQRGLVPPEKMGHLLEDMLKRTRGLQIVSLRSLPVQRFETPGSAPAAKPAEKGAKAAPPKDPDRVIYQHSFEITLLGNYADVHDYLSQLEKLPWRMFWGRISVTSEHHPRLRVTMTVQTLSLNKAWLVV